MSDHFNNVYWLPIVPISLTERYVLHPCTTFNEFNIYAQGAAEHT